MDAPPHNQPQISFSISGQRLNRSKIRYDDVLPAVVTGVKGNSSTVVVRNIVSVIISQFRAFIVPILHPSTNIFCSTVSVIHISHRTNRAVGYGRKALIVVVCNEILAPIRTVAGTIGSVTNCLSVLERIASKRHLFQ